MLLCASAKKLVNHIRSENNKMSICQRHIAKYLSNTAPAINHRTRYFHHKEIGAWTGIYPFE